VAYRPALPRSLLLAPLDIQESTRCSTVDVVVGLQLVTVNMTRNEIPNDDWHTIWIGVEMTKKSSRDTSLHWVFKK
jgi:hypothetical protein